MPSNYSPEQLLVSYQQRNYDAFAQQAKCIAQQMGERQPIGVAQDLHRVLKRCFVEASAANDLRYVTCLVDLTLVPPTRALACAAQYGHTDVLAQLLRTNTEHKSVADALSWAALGGQPDTARMLLDTLPSAQFDFSALTMAVRGGNMEVVDMVQTRTVFAYSAEQKAALFLAACVSTVAMLERFVGLIDTNKIRNDKHAIVSLGTQTHVRSPSELKIMGAMAAAQAGRAEVLRAIFARMNQQSINEFFVRLSHKNNKISADLLAQASPLDKPHIQQQIAHFALQSGDEHIIERTFALMSWDTLDHQEIARTCATFSGYAYYQRMLLHNTVSSEVNDGRVVNKRKI